MAEKIVVSVRVRPLNGNETSKGAAWDVDNASNVITPQVRLVVRSALCSGGNERGARQLRFESRLTPTLSSLPPPSHPPRVAQPGSSAATTDGAGYALDNVFDETSTTKDVYAKTTKGIIDSVVGGFNGTVFAYGQTSSGKTHTMQGCEGEPGIIPLAVKDVFEAIEASEGREFLVRVSYLEIYNEQMMDLLSKEVRLLPIRPRSRGARRSLRTFPVVTLHPRFPFNV